MAILQEVTEPLALARARSSSLIDGSHGDVSSRLLSGQRISSIYTLIRPVAVDGRPEVSAGILRTTCSISPGSTMVREARKSCIEILLTTTRLRYLEQESGPIGIIGQSAGQASVSESASVAARTGDEVK